MDYVAGTITADNMNDTVTFTPGNKWIHMAVSGTNDEDTLDTDVIKIAHEVTVFDDGEANKEYGLLADETISDADKHLKEVQRLSLNGEIVERQSFLMINAIHNDNSEKDLLKRCLDLSNKFERCGIKTEILDESSLIQLCNSFLNMNYAHREDTDIEDKVLMLKEA